MHELSIARSLVETVSQAAREAGARRVTLVRLKVGELSGVAREALEFCYDVATAATLLDGSRLVVETVPVVVFCPVCDRETVLPSVTRFRCPVCETPTGDVRQGRELEIDSIEIQTEADLEPTADPVSARAGNRPEA